MQSSEKDTTTPTSPKSPLAEMFGRAKAKIGELKERSASSRLADDEEDFEQMKAKALEKQRRKEDYERLDLANKTKFGVGGASFGS